jgi:DNA-directed RNA polymerase specialized sigma24 family protein
MTARLSSTPHKETWIPLQVLTYCTFTLREWKPDVQLEFKNGNQYDVRPDNLQPKQKYIPPEWSERMTWREKIYKANFMHVAWSVNYVTDLDIEDCKDLAQSAFIYLCTDGYRPIQHKTEIVGLWVDYARMRAIDYIKRRWLPDSELVERQGNRDKPYEIDLFHLQPGEKRSTYLRMWAEGNTPTEIAEVCGCKPSTVGASVTRSIQFLQRYFKKEL